MRVTIGALLLQLICVPTSLASADRSVELRSLQWKHRVLLLPALSESSHGADWKTHREAVLDRDLVLFRAEADHYAQCFPEPRSPTRLAVPRKMREAVSDRVTLIGKDGGIKGQWQRERSELPNAVFELIDSMPMRQRERSRSAPTSHVSD